MNHIWKSVLLGLIVFTSACSGCEETPVVEPPGKTLIEPVVCKQMGWACTPADTTEEIHYRSLDVIVELEDVWERSKDMEQVLGHLESKEGVIFSQISSEGSAVVFRLKDGLAYRFGVSERAVTMPPMASSPMTTRQQSLEQATYATNERMNKRALIVSPGLWEFETYAASHIEFLEIWAERAKDYTDVTVKKNIAIPPTVNKAYVLKTIEGFKNWSKYDFVTMLAHGLQVKLKKGTYKLGGYEHKHISLFDAGYLGQYIYQNKASRDDVHRRCPWEVFNWIKNTPGVGCGYTVKGFSYDTSSDETFPVRYTHLLVTTDFFIAHDSAPIADQHITFMACQSGKYGPALPLGDNGSALGFSNTVYVNSIKPMFEVHRYMWRWGMDVDVAMDYVSKHISEPLGMCSLKGVENKKVIDICLKSFTNGAPRGPKERIEGHQPDGDEDLLKNNVLEMTDSSNESYPYEVSLKVKVMGIDVSDAVGSEPVYCALPDFKDLTFKPTFGEGAPQVRAIEWTDMQVSVDDGSYFAQVQLYFDQKPERPINTTLELSMTEPSSSGKSCRGYESVVTYPVYLKPPSDCGRWSASVGQLGQVGNHAYILDNFGVVTMRLEDVTVYTEDAYESEGMEFTIYFPDGLKSGVPVQLAGTDGTYTWTSESETSVQFIGEQLPSGQWKGVISGRVNEVVGDGSGNTIERTLRIDIKTLSVNDDDFDGACLR